MSKDLNQKLNKQSLDIHRKKLKEEALSSRRNKLSKITVHMGTCGIASGAEDIKNAVLETIEKNSMKDKIDFAVSGCAGFCSREPMLTIESANNQTVIYHSLDREKLDKVFEKHILKGEVAKELDPITGDSELNAFYINQVPRVMHNRGKIDPFSIDDYIRNDGYHGFAKALEKDCDEIIKIVIESGLRGRGGAGFPVGKKWLLCKNASSPKGRKFIICNGDEGDPGAFMDRNLLESDPHSVIEGILIAAFAIGSNKGYMYIRAEYPLAIKTVMTSLEQARLYGLLGTDILGTGFDFDIEIYQGAGAFVCGEETALMQSIEGKRGMPRPKPPFPANQGLYGMPTLINNVETLANIPQILLNGAEWFSSIGTEKSKGTKIFALTGAVNYVGLVEVPMGITLRDIVYKIGGGIKGAKKFKAVQIGGPSGGCLPDKYLDTPVDYEKVKEVGAIMGSGGMIILDEDTCMVNLSRYFMDFIQDESCGQCTPCRIGTRRMLEMLEKITQGKGNRSDIEKLEKLGPVIKETSLCGLGKSAPNPVLSTINYFRDEYLAHVDRKRCPAVECREIISSPCQHTCPIGTEAQVYIALTAQGRFKEAFDVIIKDNPLPSVCGRICHHPCETKCEAGKWGNPITIRSLKRFATDYAIRNGVYPEKEQARDVQKGKIKGNRAAIIGSGPAGLMAGYNLGIAGYDVTVFEELELPGGGLAVYIPDFRLPKKILALDIEHIKNAGVEIRTNTKIGKDITFEKILKEYKSVFIATGAHNSRKLGIENDDAEGVIAATEFLKKINLKKPVKVGRFVGIIGGGNSAVDAARVAARLPGCESVTIIYRRTIKEMPAFEEEVKVLLEEGIDIQFLTAPVNVIVKNGKVKGLRCKRMELGELDETGRRKPVPVEDSEFDISLETLIAAIGEYPDLSFKGAETKLEITERGTIKVDPETYQTSIKGVFAGGDAVTGPATVIQAMGTGKVVAEMMDKYMTGKPIKREYIMTRPSMYVPPVEMSEEEIGSLNKPVLSYLPDKARIETFEEVLLNMADEQAIREAKRCLRCDLETEQGKMLVKKA